MNIINHGKTKQNKDQPQKWLDYPSHQDDPGHLSIWLINDYNIYCRKTLNLYSSLMNIINNGRIKQNKDQPLKWTPCPFPKNIYCSLIQSQLVTTFNPSFCFISTINQPSLPQNFLALVYQAYTI